MELKNSSAVFTRWQFCLHTTSYNIQMHKVWRRVWLFAPIRECLTLMVIIRTHRMIFARLQIISLLQFLKVTRRCQWIINVILFYIFLRFRWVACTGLLWKAKGFDAQSWCVRWVDTFLICSSSGHNVHSSSTSCTASLLEAGMYVCAFACRYQGEVAPAKWKWPEQNAKEVEREWVSNGFVLCWS